MYHRTRAFWLLLMILTVLSTPAWATPLTWNFTGVTNDRATYSGTFTYESTEAPSAFNVHGLNGNTVYALQSWEFTSNINFVGTGIEGVPSSITWSNLLANNTAEFCLGKCIFSSTLFDRLLFSNGQQSLQLLFSSPNTFALPSTTADWGPLEPNGSHFRSNAADGTFQALVTVTGGALTGGASSVPEPPTFWLMLLGFAGLAGLVAWRARQQHSLHDNIWHHSRAAWGRLGLYVGLRDSRAGKQR
jgi:PEP-CTERM motif-containing protein